MNKLEIKLIVVENSIDEIRKQVKMLEDAKKMSNMDFYLKYDVYNPSKQAALEHCKMIRRTMMEISKMI